MTSLKLLKFVLSLNLRMISKDSVEPTLTTKENKFKFRFALNLLYVNLYTVTMLELMLYDLCNVK